MRLNIARTLPRSTANGPGERHVIWVQGCNLACEGCWNPDTWPFTRASLREIDELEQEILAIPDLEGVTFTGGEPFQQARSLGVLAARLRQHGLSVVIFTGYDLPELQSSEAKHLLSHTDLLIAGRYRQDLACRGAPLISSSNQQLHFLTDRYDADDLLLIPEIELHIDSAGAIAITGFPDADLLNNISSLETVAAE